MASHLDPVEENVLRLLESAEPIDFSGEVWHQIMAAGDVRLMIWCQEEGYTGDERLLSWAVSPVVVSDLCQKCPNFAASLTIVALQEEMMYQAGSVGKLDHLRCASSETSGNLDDVSLQEGSVPEYSLGVTRSMSLLTARTIQRLLLAPATLRWHLMRLRLSEVVRVHYDLDEIAEQHAVLKSAIEETKDAMRAREAADEHEKTVAAARAEFDSKYKLDPGLDSQESPVLEARRKTYTFSTTKLDVVKSIYEDIDAYVKDSKRHLDDLLENLNAPILRPAKFREIPAAREEEYYPLIKEHLEREGRRLQQVLIIKMLDQTTGRTQLQVQLATRGLITRAVGNTDLVVLTQDADVEAAMLRALCVLLEMKTTKQAANLDKLSAQVLLQLPGGTLKAQVPVLAAGGDCFSVLTLAMARGKLLDNVRRLFIDLYENVEVDKGLALLLQWAKLASHRDPVCPEELAPLFPANLLEGAEFLRRNVCEIRNESLEMEEVEELQDAQKENNLACQEELRSDDS